MESWLSGQAEKNVLSWERSIARFYPQYLEMWTNPDRHYRALTEEWNTLAAAQSLDWDRYLQGRGLKILDLGAGAGWLSILLSTRANVDKVYALDASPTNLRFMLPALAERMGGKPEKITPVLALFTPILVGDNFFDGVVASSSVHHAPDLSECLREVYRVLKPNGFFLILNEQTFSYLRYALLIAIRCARLLSRVIMRQWQPVPKWVSESGLLMDPYLGDRAYGDWQWKCAVEQAGFSFQRIVTPYYPYKDADDRRNQVRLAHFIAQKLASRSQSRA